MQSNRRLKNRKSFTYIYAHGKSVRCEKLSLVFLPSKYPAKVGFSVGKKVGGAVQRNKVKRRLKSIFIGLYPSLDSKFNYIIVAHGGTYEMSYTELFDNVTELLKKADKVYKTE